MKIWEKYRDKYIKQIVGQAFKEWEEFSRKGYCSRCSIACGDCPLDGKKECCSSPSQIVKYLNQEVTKWQKMEARTCSER